MGRTGMSILLHAPRGMPATWEAPVRAVFANEDLLLAMPDDPAAAARVECVIVFGAGEGVLARLPNLKFISTMGMGVDHILKDPGLPPSVPIARVVDPAMIDQMAEYVTLAASSVRATSTMRCSGAANGSAASG
jgi:glyoxylate/hydroxypyruvate reductase A